MRGIVGNRARRRRSGHRASHGQSGEVRLRLNGLAAWLVVPAVGLLVVAALVMGPRWWRAASGEPDNHELMFHAIAQGDVETVRQMLSAGVSANAVTMGNVSALTFAAGYGETDVVRLLLAHGADHRMVSDVGHTPLIAACRATDDGIATILLDAGADPNAHGPLCAAVLTNRPSLLQLLLSRGAAPDSRGPEGATPLTNAAAGGCDAEIIRVLLAAGADVNLPDGQGQTALAYATRAGRDDVVALLRDAGAEDL